MHNKLADVLYSREVIFTEDVEQIFGKRKWVSRTDEILAAQQSAEKNGAAAKDEKANDAEAPAVEDVEATEVIPPADIPPVPGKKQKESESSDE